MLKTVVKKGNIDRSDIYRAVLTDTSPQDVPIVFSNDGLHANLINKNPSDEMGEIIKRLIRENPERFTVPYRYKIRQTAINSRQMSLAHPAAQAKAAKFYGEFGHLIPYFCRRDEISLRRPEKIGSSISLRTGNSGRKKYKGAAIDTLLQDQTVRNPGSFFAYAGVDRFYRFFSSADFNRIERTFSKMRLTDVSKCFSSIYSHTLAWAVKDIEHGKESTNASSFANAFDDVMQFSNYNETNGIPVGAEISRIFSEIILQSVDSAIIRRCDAAGLSINIDYSIKRYIDDYVIFSNTEEKLDELQRLISEELSVFNLHLNDAKTYSVNRPLQTRKSRAISHVGRDMEKFRNTVLIPLEGQKGHAPNVIRNGGAVYRKLIDDVKLSCSDSGAGYEDASPYVIGSVASIVETLVTSYKISGLSGKEERAIYLPVMKELVCCLYFFLTVHLTVPASYQVAKTTILVLRFFAKNLPELHAPLQETVSFEIAKFVSDPALLGAAKRDYVPIEILNIMLAADELKNEFRVAVDDLAGFILSAPELDYFSVSSLLFYVRDQNPEILTRIEKKLLLRSAQGLQPRKRSSDAHFILDMISCPYLSKPTRMKLVNTLYKSVELALGSVVSRQALIEEFQNNPWFINWKQVDLLNHLRKKELSTTY